MGVKSPVQEKRHELGREPPHTRLYSAVAAAVGCCAFVLSGHFTRQPHGSSYVGGPYRRVYLMTAAGYAVLAVVYSLLYWRARTRVPVQHPE